jgi:hypothetical protein
MAALKKDTKEMITRSDGHATIWGTHLGVGRTRDVAGRYQQFRDRWIAYKAARQEAKLASRNACWNADREVYKPLRAEAAIEMAIAQGALSMATQPYSLIQ